MEPMLELFIYETSQLIEQLEQLILDSEKNNGLKQYIDEIFRIMHTIKGSSAMMLLNNISLLAHSVEDVFFFLRENRTKKVKYSQLTDIILEVIDFIGSEVIKIKDNKSSDGDPSKLIGVITEFLCDLKGQTRDMEDKATDSGYTASPDMGPENTNDNRYKAVIFFEEGCEMENIRAFAVVHNMERIARDISYFPEGIIDGDESIEMIRKNGFEMYFTCDLPENEIRGLLEETIFLKELIIERNVKSEGEEAFIHSKDEIDLDRVPEEFPEKIQNKTAPIENSSNLLKQNFISVNIQKMNKLMDLMGELVISEAMVTQNPDLRGLELENFKKSARQLKKITGELQDIVMSMRMVPLSTTFQKMNRTVRDMCRKLNKEVHFEIIGEETEVDKNIIEHISDPLIHLIRNAVDHGLEAVEERRLKGKPDQGKITLEARNAGGDVWIVLKDDGRGLDKEKILKKAMDNNILHKSVNELSDNEIYSFILLPGFSTKDDVTEFSGRGVGMDVVTKNIEKIRGNVLIDSVQGSGTTVSIKIPLTLAIVDGMIIKVGNASYTIPTTSIRESIRAGENSIIKDPDGNEMIMIRGQCYPILRLHEFFNINSAVEHLDNGIVIMVENEAQCVCLFADALIEEQQVVVKALPQYIKKVRGISGCTLLGDGSISLIVDISSLINSKQ